MAELRIEGNELVLHLSGVEKAEGIHGDLRVPVSAVKSVELLNNAHEAADFLGFRSGTRVFGIVEVGTIRGAHKKVFAVVHHDTPRGVRITLNDQDQDEWVVGCTNPEDLIAKIPTTG